MPLRKILFDLGTANQQIDRAVPDDPAPVQPAGVYHNPIRRWADV
jgi:predicted 2-oxoglutarate/Fe(II)-dependent dioxygenase YbiX